ncbi:MAG: DUF4139 domain-containing protein [Nitrospiraceae bacterium]|nr:DUF4139 domain-containing protein [Nitrospiraceae bacterium]
MRALATWVVVVTVAWTPGAAQAGEVKLEDPLANIHASETTLADQTDVAVTVYNNDLALVRDRRKVALLPGEVTLKFSDVAAKIRPETVSLRSLSRPDALHILEQNYAYDLMSPAKLMEKYVGKRVRLVNFSNELGFYEKEATLLSVNEGPIYQIDKDIFLGHPGNVALPEIPENLIAKPSLIWLLDNGGTDHEIEATYLTRGIGWRADYVISLDRSDTQMDLEGWVTLDNESGAQYTNAQLKLVAGEVNIVQPEMKAALRGYAAGMRTARAPAPMRQESFAEYHLYTLPRRTTIKQNESKQVRLLTVSRVAVRKEYEYRGDVSFYYQPTPVRKDDKVGVFLVFENEEANALGMPLPGGVMRVYQEDSDGMLQFAGEDRVKHTPKDEEVRLRLGNAFDIVGERTQTDFEEVAGNVTESAFKIAIRNHKETAVTVDIVEPMPNDWKIIEQSQDFVKKDAHTAIFKVLLAPDGEAAVTYRVRVTR